MMSVQADAKFDDVITGMKKIMMRRCSIADFEIMIIDAATDYIKYLFMMKSARYGDGIHVLHIKNTSPTVSLARTVEKDIEKHTIILCDLPPTAQFKKIFVSSFNDQCK